MIFSQNKEKGKSFFSFGKSNNEKPANTEEKQQKQKSQFF